MKNEDNNNHFQEHRNHRHDLSTDRHIQKYTEDMNRQQRNDDASDKQIDNLLEVCESIVQYSAINI